MLTSKFTVSTLHTGADGRVSRGICAGYVHTHARTAARPTRVADPCPPARAYATSLLRRRALHPQRFWHCRRHEVRLVVSWSARLGHPEWHLRARDLGANATALAACRPTIRSPKVRGDGSRVLVGRRALHRLDGADDGMLATGLLRTASPESSIRQVHWRVAGPVRRSSPPHPLDRIETGPEHFGLNGSTWGDRSNAYEQWRTQIESGG